MPDPMDELENFSTPGLTMDPLPAAEVRRRGTRMRRRNSALATIGAVAAVAVIATPIAIAANGTNNGGHTPGPANPSPTVTEVGWVATIPAGFPLTTGLPETNGHDGSPVEARDGFEQQVPENCDGAGWTADGVSDAAQATYTGESEGGDDRALALYPTEAAAEQVFVEVETKVQDCAIATTGAKRRWTEVVPSGLGGRSLVYANHYTDGGDTHVVQIVRIGNAILQDATFTMGGGDPAVMQQTVDLLQERSAEAVDQLCIFSADPC